MSFYEDNIADGSHCGSCCEYIGAGEGFPQFCRSCQPGAGVQHKPIKQKKQVKIAKLKAWLAEHNIKHSVHNNDAHFILHPPTGALIDCWPTTSKWQQRGGPVRADASGLAALFATAKHGWIKCSDRLPEYNQNVLVCFNTVLGTQQITTAELNHQKRCADPASTDHDDIWYVTVGWGHKIKPTHWQPLPAPPTE